MVTNAISMSQGGALFILRGSVFAQTYVTTMPYIILEVKNHSLIC